MDEAAEARLIAWHHEIKEAHQRLRRALQVAKEALRAGEDVPAPERDLLIYCHGFCVALSRHHQGEDQALFPTLGRLRPGLGPVLDALEQDHRMIAHLVHALQRALSGNEPVSTLMRHLEGIAAIMESHFRYEERELLDTLATITLDLDPPSAFGPL